MRSVHVFLAITLVVVVLATAGFLAVFWFGFSSLNQPPNLQTAASGPTQQTLIAAITDPAGATVFLMAGQSRNFTGTASGGSGSYAFDWNFGDGSNSSGASVSKAFVQPGTFPVVLTANDGTNQATDSLQVIVSGAIFSASILTPPAGATLIVGEATNFGAAATGGVSPYQFDWDFGDGNTETSQNPSHTYTVAGSRVVTLNVQDNAIPPHQMTKTIQLNVVNPPPEPVQASIMTPGAGASFAANQPVAFSGAAAGGTGAYIYEWRFGDGRVAFTPSASHTYTNAGVYTADLRVRDNQNNEDTGSVQITITSNLSPFQPSPPGQPPSPTQPPSTNNQLLRASISNPSNNATFLVNQGINFTSGATGGSGAYTFRWDFGDGTTVLNANHIHIKSYTQTGTKTVSLQVSDSSFNQDTATIVININSPPPHQSPPSNQPPPNPSGGGGNNQPSVVSPTTIPLPVQTSTTPCVSTSVALADLPLLVGPFAFGMQNNQQVMLLQRMLSFNRTIYPEGIISGYYGPLTREAVKRFQFAYKILDPATADPELLGFAGPRTRAEINKVYRDTKTITNCPATVTPGIQTTNELTPEQRLLLLGQLKTLFISLRTQIVGWLTSLSTILVP